MNTKDYNLYKYLNKFNKIKPYIYIGRSMDPIILGNYKKDKTYEIIFKTYNILDIVRGGFIFSESF